MASYKNWAKKLYEYLIEFEDVKRLVHDRNHLVFCIVLSKKGILNLKRKKKHERSLTVYVEL